MSGSSNPETQLWLVAETQETFLDVQGITLGDEQDGFVSLATPLLPEAWPSFPLRRIPSTIHSGSSTPGYGARFYFLFYFIGCLDFEQSELKLPLPTISGESAFFISGHTCWVLQSQSPSSSLSMLSWGSENAP